MDRRSSLSESKQRLRLEIHSKNQHCIRGMPRCDLMMRALTSDSSCVLWCPFWKSKPSRKHWFMPGGNCNSMPGRTNHFTCNTGLSNRKQIPKKTSKQDIKFAIDWPNLASWQQQILLSHLYGFYPFYNVSLALMSHLVPWDGKPKSAKAKPFQCDLNLSCFFYIWKRFKMLWCVNDNKDTHLQEMGLVGLCAGMNGQKVRLSPQRCIWFLCPCTGAEWESSWSHLLHRWSSVGQTEPGWPPAAVHPWRPRACHWSPDTSEPSCFHKNPWLLLRCDGKDSAGQRGSEKTITSWHKVRPDASGNGKDRMQWHTGMTQKNHTPVKKPTEWLRGREDSA